jgi:hypothetical protein
MDCFAPLAMTADGKEIAGEGEWGAALLKDFAEFEKRGLKHGQMAEVRRLLAPVAAPAR